MCVYSDPRALAWLHVHTCKSLCIGAYEFSLSMGVCICQVICAHMCTRVLQDPGNSQAGNNSNREGGSSAHFFSWDEEASTQLPGAREWEVRALGHRYWQATI